MKAKSYKVPFKGRTMLEYTQAGAGQVAGDLKYESLDTPTEWREIEPFQATVRLLSHGRGRSSVRVYVSNVKNDERYSMAIAAFYEAVVAFGSHKGCIEGTWSFRKQGSNYTLWPEIEDLLTPEQVAAFIR